MANLGGAARRGSEVKVEQIVTCHSDRAESPIYPGDHTPGVTDKAQDTWRLGVTTFLEPPKNERNYQVVIGYRRPAADKWEDSKPLDSVTISNGILTKIGRGAVAFSAYFQAPVGSPACEGTPVASFQGPDLLADRPEPPPQQPDWP
ncbi:MAG: hypothetical protein AAB834_02705 [Patescibacteria group bacterium]